MLDEWMQALDDLLPEVCPTCKKKGPAIKISCPCKFELTTCASCLSNNRDIVHEALREHMNVCEDGGIIISALGF